MAPWCSGQTCHPVTVEIAGSNPAGVASNISGVTFKVYPKEGLQLWPRLLRLSIAELPDVVNQRTLHIL